MTEFDKRLEIIRLNNIDVFKSPVNHYFTISETPNNGYQIGFFKGTELSELIQDEITVAFQETFLLK